MKNNNFVKYQDLLTIKKFNEKTNEEKFVFIPEKDDYVVGKYQNDKNMLNYGNKIAVRATVYEKLKKVAQKLKEHNENYKLIVVFGFRDMKLQEKYFYEIYDEVKDDFDNELEMYEYIHEKIAVPEVAGHPTGGAVDVAICDLQNEKIIDFGSRILDWDTTKSYYYSEDIFDKAISNRKLLRKLMLSENFAPYDGEWWHFSYGDREWAFYYNQPEALYKQVNAEDILKKFYTDR
jgi:D-alanyl-D-alanine dipeptidase